GDSLAVDVDYVPGVLNVSRAEWVAGKSRAKLAGTIRPRFTLEDWTKALGKHDPSWATRATLALEGTAESFDLGLIAPVDTTLRTFEGTATFRVRATGTPGNPVFDLDARVPSLGFRGVTGELVGLRMSYKERRLRIERCDVHQGEAISKLTGEIPIDLGLYATERLSRTEPLSLSLRVPGGDISVLPVLFPDIASASGRVTATADVKGTPRQPTVTGNLKIVDGRLRLAGRDEIIEGITVDAVFDEERVEITKATARQGKKGSLSATGWWRWPTAAPGPFEPPPVGPRGDYAFKIKATDFTTTDRLNYLFRLTGALDIVNARNPAGAVVPSITGNVTINKGELTLDLSKPPEEPGEPLPILYYINVDIPGNVFYRTLDAEVELESDGNVIFKNEGNGDLALGILNVKGGKYYILTRQFRNLQGTVNFNNPDRIDPEVNISADTTIPDPEKTHTVYLALSDRVSRLKVRVYDDNPNTSPNDLWKALALGQFAPSAGVNVNAGPSSLDTPGAALPISNYLFQNLEHIIGGTGFVDTIDLRSGASAQASGGGSTTTSSSPVSMVGVGKYVTPDLYLKYARDFSGTGEEQINADYRFTRHLLLKGQQINRKAGTTGVQDAQEYSIDLKVRLEY
ncbi:MAG: translocation/assembly module TamB domain-containing protein, partial [Candidatus Eiseniibacteriota bacterium]